MSRIDDLRKIEDDVVKFLRDELARNPIKDAEIANNLKIDVGRIGGERGDVVIEANLKSKGINKRIAYETFPDSNPGMNEWLVENFLGKCDITKERAAILPRDCVDEISLRVRELVDISPKTRHNVYENGKLTGVGESKIESNVLKQPEQQEERKSKMTEREVDNLARELDYTNNEW